MQALTVLNDHRWGTEQDEEVKPKVRLTIKELRSMANDKNRAAWIGLALTIVVQAVILSAWVGGVSARVEENTKKVEAVVTEQKAQGNLVYGLPYLQQSVQEIKGDVKDLKQLILQQGNNNQKGRQQ